MEGGSSSGEKPQSDYQVFLSFRGCDTRQGFTDCLYHFLTDVGVRVFRDNEELRPGHKIREVLTAINKSIVCIPILSKNYANSKWCLLELAEMVRLKKDIMPIFYKVEVDDVKLKTRLYSDHLSKFGKEHDAVKEEWERALKEVGGIFDKAQLEGTFKEVGRIKAWTIMNYPGYGELSKEVVCEVRQKLEVKHKIFEGPLVGIDGHVKAMMELLDIGSPEVRFVVIHGVGCAGKTTLSKVIFNQLCDSHGGFQHCCFLDNIRETANHQGIVHLQNKLLREISPWIREIYDIDSGIKTIKDIVKNKRVLIILDDLDQCKQIERLAGDVTWFDSGSRIIVTTRDLSCVVGLPKLWYYNMSEMSSDCALQLFCRHAFKMDSPPGNCLDISMEVVAACGRLPLALKVMGSYLHHIEKEHWKSKIKMIASHKDVQEKLMISYNALDPRTKEIILDIACFFVGREINNAMYMWEACDFRPREGIQRLLSMSLVKISEDDTFLMPDLLRDLGREIVIQENFRCPEKRSRLWSQKEVNRVLSRGKGTSETNALRVICSSNPDAGIQHNIVTADQIRPLQNMRFLELESVCLEGDFCNALQDLKWLSWTMGTVKTTVGVPKATNLVLQDLVVLELSGYDISDEWLNPIEIGENLKVLKFIVAGYEYTPRRLTKLTQILEVSSSLVELQISSRWFREVPESIGNLYHLKVMNLSHSSMSKLPSSIGNLKNLEELHAARSKLKYIPEEIRRLHRLRVINLQHSDINKLPSTIHELPLLQHLNLENCDGIQELPNLPSSLTVLRVRSRSLSKFPNLSNLERLNDLVLCGNHRYVPTISKQRMPCHSPVWINNCPSLESLELDFRDIISLEMQSSAFPRIKKLELNCPDLEVLEQLPLSLTRLKLRANVAGTILSACLGGMEALNDLELLNIRFVHELPLPRNLKTLSISWCSFPEPLLNLSGLKMLEELRIKHCGNLKAIRGVEDMKLLEKLYVCYCPSLTEISDLSKFERLLVETDNPMLFKGVRPGVTVDRPRIPVQIVRRF